LAGAASWHLAVVLFCAMLGGAPAQEIAAPPADVLAGPAFEVPPANTLPPPNDPLPLVDHDPAVARLPMPKLAIPELAAAIKLDRKCNCHCVDLYYRAAMRAWQCLAEESSPDISDQACDAVFNVYQQSLAGLIGAGERYGRLDPRGHLTVDDGVGPIEIPFTYYGLAWRAEDFCKLLPASRYRSDDIVHHYAAPGLGLSLIAVRVAPPKEPYTLPKQPFAVTALLRPTSSLPAGSRGAAAVSAREDGRPAGEEGPPAVLEFYNPYVCESVELYGSQVPLARDLSAPLALMYLAAPKNYLEGFISPDDGVIKPELLLIEPYQPGKNPVIFIHGLASSPLAWLDAANELKAQPDLYRRFQFWVFQYPTGGAVLESAAALRNQLRAVRQELDPQHQDAALDNMVVIGHSMGGLMAKFQITDSEDILWRRLASGPLDAVQTTPEIRDELARSFFFDPVPSVKRVVFAGTPFQGSSWASRSVGRVCSNLIRFQGPEELAYRQLMRDNRDIFSPYLWRKRPTSIDILEPRSPILEALQEMPINPSVTMHTIIGTGAIRLLREPSDGVVTVSSAQQSGAVSELHVPALHMQLHSAPQTIVELIRILRLHAAEAQAAAYAEARRTGVTSAR
jgi:pimeloyl-ACP methyl ester carboxylesterase